MLALSLGATVVSAVESPAPPAARVIAGELTRVDLTRRSVSVKTDGRDPRELEVATGPDTRLVSRGRAVRLEDLRPGDRVLLVTGDEGDRRLARVVKVVGRVALPAPSPAAPPPATSVPPVPGSPG
jgi:hypothetical protein